MSIERRSAITDTALQIIVEALIALVLFLPGTALTMAPLKDVTYRGELAKRSVSSRIVLVPLESH